MKTARAAYFLVFLAVVTATASIAASLYTAWFIPVSVLVPIACGVASAFSCRACKVTRRQRLVSITSGLIVPAFCSFICWKLYLENLIT